ncbi:hypothetical protein SUDANB25_01660 [Streptomyces sp. SudanB25_2051]
MGVRGPRGAGEGLVVAVEDQPGEGGVGAERGGGDPGRGGRAAGGEQPGAVKQEATATRVRPRAVSSRTASGTVGEAAEA